MGDTPSSSSAPSHEKDEATRLEDEDGSVDSRDEEELDAEAQALLEDLSNSQAEVQRMIDDHKKQTAELGGLRDNLASELEELQQERWKLELYGELEVLKRQLESLKALEQDLDASEAVLDATEPGGSPSRYLAAHHQHDGAGPSSSDALVASEGPAVGPSAGPGEVEIDNEDDEDYDPAAIAEMQAKLDQDLADMFAQLQAVKSEAAAVSAHKAKLEAELRALIEEQVDFDEDEPEADSAAVTES